MIKCTEIKENIICDIYSNCSMRNPKNVKIYKQTPKYIYYKEQYDSWVHAPSQEIPKESKFKKAEIDHIEYK